MELFTGVDINKLRHSPIYLTFVLKTPCLSTWLTAGLRPFPVISTHCHSFRIGGLFRHIWRMASRLQSTTCTDVDQVRPKQRPESQQRVFWTAFDHPSEQSLKRCNVCCAIRPYVRDTEIAAEQGHPSHKQLLLLQYISPSIQVDTFLLVDGRFK